MVYSPSPALDALKAGKCTHFGHGMYVSHGNIFESLRVNGNDMGGFVVAVLFVD